jgi:hypothetical protein
VVISARYLYGMEGKPPLRFRKRRVAWSVAWGVLALLLIVFWVRSYWITDLVSRINSRRIATTIGSQYGVVYFAHFDAEIGYRHSTNPSNPRPWAIRSLRGYDSNNGLFVWERDETSLYAALPHWFIAAIVVGVGSVLWLPWRFSLRTLLVATTLVAVGLGLLIYAAKNDAFKLYH